MFENYLLKAAETMEDLYIPLFFLFIAFAPIFLFCELGDRILDVTIGLPKVLIQYDWYAYPICLWNDIIIMLICAQRPVCMRGACNIVCTRETLKNVSFYFNLH